MLRLFEGSIAKEEIDVVGPLLLQTLGSGCTCSAKLAVHVMSLSSIVTLKGLTGREQSPVQPMNAELSSAVAVIVLTDP